MSQAGRLTDVASPAAQSRIELARAYGRLVGSRACITVQKFRPKIRAQQCEMATRSVKKRAQAVVLHKGVGWRGNPPQSACAREFLQYARHQLKEQNFSCYVSRIPFQSPSEMSLERTDQHGRYTAENCQFIMRWFQRHHSIAGEMQWTPVKFEAVLTFRRNHLKGVNWTMEVKDARKWMQGQKAKSGPKPTLVRLYFRIAHSMRSSTAKRNKARKPQNKKPMPPPAVSLQDFVDLYESQKGLYAYLGFPLRLDTQSIGGAATDWAISPERVDDDGGYTMSNLVLVVREVNFYVRGVRQNEPLKWSKEAADKLFAQA